MLSDYSSCTTRGIVSRATCRGGYELPYKAAWTHLLIAALAPYDDSPVIISHQKLPPNSSTARARKIRSIHL
jgi:hypothetical protein